MIFASDIIVIFYYLINQSIMMILGYDSGSTQDVSFKELFRILFRLESITPVILLHWSLRKRRENERISKSG